MAGSEGDERVSVRVSGAALACRHERLKGGRASAKGTGARAVDSHSHEGEASMVERE